MIHRGDAERGSKLLHLAAEDSRVLEPGGIAPILPVHDAPLLTCLKLTGRRVGVNLEFRDFDSCPRRDHAKGSLILDLRASGSAW